MKKLILALIALACAFAISSCNDQIQENPEREERKCDRCHNELVEQQPNPALMKVPPPPAQPQEKTYRRW